MKLMNLLFFAKVLFLITFLGFSGTNLTATPTSEEVASNCPTTPAAWYENVSLESFDLFWEEAPGAIEYLVEIYVNGALSVELATNETNAFVIFSQPLAPGDVVEYQITTICETGYSNYFSERFFIIETVDVVMGMSVPTNQLECEECPYVVNTNIPQNGLFQFYDCPCVQSFGWASFCRINSFSMELKKCGSDLLSRTNEEESQNIFSPNPFSDQTKAEFKIIAPGLVHFSIIDFSGQEVLTLIDNEYREPGSITISLNGSSMEKGIYYYKFISGNQQKVGRIVKF